MNRWNKPARPWKLPKAMLDQLMRMTAQEMEKAMEEADALVRKMFGRPPKAKGKVRLK